MQFAGYLFWDFFFNLDQTAVEFLKIKLLLKGFLGEILEKITREISQRIAWGFLNKTVGELLKRNAKEKKNSKFYS